MEGIVIGARVLDVLTTGMYPEALDALREYIQNSFDGIRKAERVEILKKNHGEVFVTINADKREVSVRDNGIGITAAEARTTLMSIGASKKRVGEEAGFRGIGRLAGLAYCDKLVFSTGYKNEPHYTELTFDAGEIRRVISNRASSTETAVELLTRATKHQLVDCPPGMPFFEVKLIGVDPKACPFLDAEKVRSYLRQTAPVEFNSQAFVYAHAKVNPLLEEHDVRRTINLTLVANGRREAIKKPYKSQHMAGTRKKNEVTITDIEIKVDESNPPRWVAWLSVTKDLSGVIDNDEVRGIRLRSNNILIGDYSTFSRIFEKVQKSYFRMNGYYSGEVHLLDPDIVPNSRRDYFEDNEAWREAEKSLIEWVRPLVKRVYQNVDERKRGADLVERDAERVFEAVDREAEQGFATDALREKAIEKIQEAEDSLQKAMTPERTPEELESLARKKEEAAAKREKLMEKRKSLINESKLNKAERKLLWLVMDAVQKACGDDLTRRVATEVDKKLNGKPPKKA